MSSALAIHSNPQGLSTAERRTQTTQVNFNPNQIPINNTLAGDLQSTTTVTLAPETIDVDQLAVHAKEESLNNQHSPDTWTAKLMEYSKLVLTRQSALRGLISVFMEDLPELLAEIPRGFKAVLEKLFSQVGTSLAIFTSPLVSRMISFVKAKEIFGDYGIENLDSLMLFTREDLVDEESFKKAGQRIKQEEIDDLMNQVKFHGHDSVKARECIDKAKTIQNFMDTYNTQNEFREKVLKLKDETIMKQSWIESIAWGGIPLAIRLFRKYVLGLDRFVGTLNYLDDANADKLGNQRSFTFRQIFGTVLAVVVNPLLLFHFIKKTKEPESTKEESFAALLKRQLDFQHGFYPKLGLFMSLGELPYILSRLFNSQDAFELVENLVKSIVNTTSLLFGDRATNGTLARSVDQQFTRKHKLEPGVFYHREPKTPNNLWGALARVFPEASTIDHVNKRTAHDPAIKKEANEIYQKTFFKGFTLHALGGFILNTIVNWSTRARVKAALRTIPA